MEDTTIEDVLKTVEAFHNQKDYQSALRTLETNKSKISEGVWHYNVGTIYGKMENWPMARFHLLMADLEGFSSSEVVNNKNLVESKLGVDKLEKPLSFEDYLRKGSLEASQGIFTTLSLLLVIAGLFLFWKKSSIKGLGIFVLLAVCVTGINLWVDSWDKFVVMKPQPLHKGPSVIFNYKDELPAGLMIMTEKKGDWLEVVYPSRYQGWIRLQDLKELR